MFKGVRAAAASIGLAGICCQRGGSASVSDSGAFTFPSGAQAAHGALSDFPGR